MVPQAKAWDVKGKGERFGKVAGEKEGKTSTHKEDNVLPVLQVPQPGSACV